MLYKVAVNIALINTHTNPLYNEDLRWALPLPATELSTESHS